MSSPYYNPEKEVSITTDHLPHWDQEGKLCCITWRMRDSLPQAKLEQWREEKAHWLRKHPKPWSDETWQDYRDTFHDSIDTWLDNGSGSCLLKHLSVRQHVIEALNYRQQQGQCSLRAYVIMPNHVHLLIQLSPTITLPRLIQGIKRHTARQINLQLNLSGSFWQPDYYDTLIRSPRHLTFVLKYIQNNPRKLSPSSYSLWERDCQ